MDFCPFLYVDKVIFQYFLCLWSFAVWVLYASVYLFFFFFSFLDYLWISWICGLVYVINFRKFSAIITSHISPTLFLLSSPSKIPIIHLKLSHSSCMFYSFFFLLFFHFSLRRFYWHIFKFFDSLFSYTQVINKSIKGILYFYCSVLIFNISFWLFLRVFISLPLIPICFPCWLIFN